MFTNMRFYSSCGFYFLQIIQKNQGGPKDHYKEKSLTSSFFNQILYVKLPHRLLLIINIDVIFIDIHWKSIIFDKGNLKCDWNFILLFIQLKSYFKDRLSVIFFFILVLRAVLRINEGSLKKINKPQN